MTICQTDMILPCRRVKRPFALGLTGSIGMGKSAVAAMLEEAGVKVFDADRAVHILQAPGGALVDVIERHFPGTTDEGGVNRAKLGAIVLGDKDKLRQLERIIHPEVARMRREFSLAHRARKAIAYDPVAVRENRQKRAGWCVGGQCCTMATAAKMHGASGHDRKKAGAYSPSASAGAY